MKLASIVTTVFALLFSTGASAWRSDCDFEDEFSNSIDVGDAVVIDVMALAGSLRITGEAGRDRIEGSGKGCAEKESQIKGMAIEMNRVGDRIEVITAIPRPYSESQWLNASIDLVLVIPDNIPLIVSDSSGDIEIENIASLQISDSSGDIEIHHVAGEIIVQRDSSGDIDISDTGPIVIRIDSSGDIDIESADSVTIDDDTSGSIYASNINGDVAIGTDTSGSITVRRISGSFTVGSDTSGGIRYRDVEGDVSLPYDDRYDD